MWTCSTISPLKTKINALNSASMWAWSTEEISSSTLLWNTPWIENPWNQSTLFSLVPRATMKSSCQSSKKSFVCLFKDLLNLLFSSCNLPAWRYSHLFPFLGFLTMGFPITNLRESPSIKKVNLRNSYSIRIMMKRPIIKW